MNTTELRARPRRERSIFRKDLHPFTRSEGAVNPFGMDYYHGELLFYGEHPATKLINERIRFDVCHPQGRLDDYFNRNVRFMSEDVPRLTIDGVTWMSLTPMEIQSCAWALHRVNGHVITAGLGLGYFALRAASKDDVSKVTVYEIEPAIIRWFDETFEQRIEMAKIEVIQGDARKLIKGKTADFVFMDIYQSLLPDDCVTDARRFIRNNTFSEYVCWGWEYAALTLAKAKRIHKVDLPPDLYSYFAAWERTPYMEEDPHSKDMLHHLYRPVPDMRFCRKVWTTMKVKYLKGGSL